MPKPSPPGKPKRNSSTRARSERDAFKRMDESAKTAYVDGLRSRTDDAALHTLAQIATHADDMTQRIIVRHLLAQKGEVASRALQTALRRGNAHVQELILNALARTHASGVPVRRDWKTLVEIGLTSTKKITPGKQTWHPGGSKQPVSGNRPETPISSIAAQVAFQLHPHHPDARELVEKHVKRLSQGGIYTLMNDGYAPNPHPDYLERLVALGRRVKAQTYPGDNHPAQRVHFWIQFKGKQWQDHPVAKALRRFDKYLAVSKDKLQLLDHSAVALAAYQAALRPPHGRPFRTEAQVRLFVRQLQSNRAKLKPGPNH